MNVVLVRVGIDSGCGGIHSPLFSDGDFEFLPIPDDRNLDERTYGNVIGRSGRNLIEYFPTSKQVRMREQSMHVDPEFVTFTYGDPTPPKRNLSRLRPEDLLVFYSGLEGWHCTPSPALYLTGYFRVKFAGFAQHLSADQILECSENFHVRHQELFQQQRNNLVLVKGDERSRLFRKAHKLGGAVRRDNGTFWQIISTDMVRVFGRFGGIGSLQRSTPRWVEDTLVKTAAMFVESLE